MLPAAGSRDAGFSPHAGGAGKVEESSTTAASRLLKQQVPIQKHRLNPCQQRITAVQMAPTCLNHADRRVGEEMNGALQQFRLRNEIRVQYADELTFGPLKPQLQGSRLETCPVLAVDQIDIEPAAAQFFCALSSYISRVVGGIIQDLDLEKFAGIIELAYGPQQPLNDVNFIKNRQLDRNFRQPIEPACRSRLVLPVFEEQIDDEIAMNPVRRQAEEHAEITECPNYVAEISLHLASRSCRWLRQQGRQ